MSPAAALAAASGAADAALAAALQGHRVLVAYGLMGELVAGLHFAGVDYMGAQADYLRTTLHVPAEVVRSPPPPPCPPTPPACATPCGRTRPRH